VSEPADGAAVAVRSSIATRIELCLFDPAGREERVDLERVDADRWQLHVAGIAHGQSYGLRADGPFDAATGVLCDRSKLLLDPRARAIDGQLRRTTSLREFGQDSAADVPRSLVIASAFDWGDDVRPGRRWEDTVIYEAHVRGATVRHPGVPAGLRGSYLGLAHEAFVEHLVGLGVTAVELLPVFEWLDEPFLGPLGLTNYWGYNPIGWFAPSSRLATTRGEPGRAVDEFKSMVRSLHGAGLEVLLDVVYNHTAEGGRDGGTLSLKGLDAPAYINATSAPAVELVLDSLAHWVTEFHVDGFRFDLAPTLGRVAGQFDATAPILEGCARDPRLAGTKLIAEPWDVDGEDGLALGRFRAPFREWNGEFRDTVRDYWRGAPHLLGSMATRLAGSTDLFAGRELTSSVNFVTSHDGFTVHDLVSYDRKHNERNGQQNLDGSDDERSTNHGVEGPTDDPVIGARRSVAVRTLLATLLLSRGVPMVLGGDELGRTQQGNNNAYCQDNEVSWIDWEHADHGLARYVAAVASLRRAHRAVLSDPTVHPRWCAPDGSQLEGWSDDGAVAMHLERAGVASDGPGDGIVLLVNGTDAEVAFTVEGRWLLELSSADADPGPPSPVGRTVGVAARSLTVLGRAGGAGQRP
jgi:isoamylase